MKILQVIDSLATGGAEKLIVETISLYRIHGIRMDVLVLKDENYPLMNELKGMNVCEVYVLGKGSVYNPKHILALSKILLRYDIAHVHLFPAQYFTVLAKVWSRASVKLVFTEHNTTNRRQNNLFFSAVDRFFYKKYDKIVAISTEIAQILKSHLRSQDSKVVVIENGVDLRKILNAAAGNRNEFFRAKESKIIVQVSAFRPQKDQQTLIKAMTQMPDFCKLVLVGEGPLKSANQMLVDSLQLEARVCFTGNRSDIPEILKMSDVVVLSSHYEGMSLSSIEGMASGKVFIASNVPGLTNLVNGAGLLFEQGNSDQLATIIKNVISDSALYEKTVRTCLNRAMQYDINKMVDHHLKLYNSLAKNN